MKAEISWSPSSSGSPEEEGGSQHVTKWSLFALVSAKVQNSKAQDNLQRWREQQRRSECRTAPGFGKRRAVRALVVKAGSSKVPEGGERFVRAWDNSEIIAIPLVYKSENRAAVLRATCFHILKPYSPCGSWESVKDPSMPAAVAQTSVWYGTVKCCPLGSPKSFCSKAWGRRTGSQPAPAAGWSSRRLSRPCQHKIRAAGSAREEHHGRLTAHTETSLYGFRKADHTELILP